MNILILYKEGVRRIH